jgi:hypothetical protein
MPVGDDHSHTVELEMLGLLVSRYAFGEVSALVAAGFCEHCRTRGEIADIQQLCAFGKRLLDLDAEDFGVADAATDANVDHSFADEESGDSVPDDLVVRSRAARMPQSPSEVDRGALASLRPPFALLLEVIAARWMRRETSDLVATMHIASEYLPMLIWEPVLGHAGDPARMVASVGGDGSRWGQLDDRACPHSKPEKSAANRALRVSGEQDAGWRSYLDRQHSSVSAALGICAADCRRPCTVMTRHSESDQERLDAACRIAENFSDSAMIQLRHSAPVGHGFGVPSPREVMDTWMHTREHLGKREPAVLVDDGFALPGLPSLVSALAGTTIVPDTLIADTAAALQNALA